MARSHTAVICGTNRPGAASRAVAGRVCEVLDELGESYSYLDLADLKGDIFDPQCYGEKPQWFLDKFQRGINDAAKLLFVVPEYNGSFPGVLKYFIDMLSFPESLKGLPVACIGLAAGKFGALRAVEQLEMIFHYRGAYLFPERLFIPQVTPLVTPTVQLGEYEERLKSLVKNFQAFRVEG